MMTHKAHVTTQPSVVTIPDAKDDPQRLLLEQFPLLADAPQSVPRMRELILQLAVRGKLVPQDPTDEPASELLKKIKAEKARLIKEGKIKKQKELTPIDEAEVPYELPLGWEWVLMDQCFDVRGGIQKTKERAPQKNHYPYLRVANVQRGQLQLKDIHRFELYGEELEKHRLKNGDLLVVEGNGSADEIGRCAIWDGSIENCVHQNHIIRCRPINNGSWPLCIVFLNSPPGIQEMQNLSVTTSGLFNLSVGKIRNILVPLPPLPEQKRIVARVDRLMALCDELEARQEARKEGRMRLNKAALHGLMEATEAEAFATHWKRIHAHFDQLYDTPKTVPDLRQAILQLAVRGKLVPQDPTDEPASELLKKIKAEKARLIKEGKIKAQKELPPIDADEVPYELPVGWEWVLMDQCFDVRGGIQKTKERAPQKNHYPYLRVANVQRGQLQLKDIHRFELYGEELEKHRLKNGDLLVVEGNGSADEIGRCAIWDGSIENCVHQNHIIRCRPINNGSWPLCIVFLNSPPGIQEMQNLSVTTSGLFNLSVGKIRNILVPLPPLAEQLRIVDRVDRLMALCDELEAKLGAAEAVQGRLLDAVVAGVVG